VVFKAGGFQVFLSLSELNADAGSCMRKDVEGARWKLHAEGCGWCTLEAAYGRMWKAHAGKERLVFTCFTYERLAFQRLLSVCFEAPQAFSKIFPSRHHAAPGLKRENYTENSRQNLP